MRPGIKKEYTADILKIELFEEKDLKKYKG